jgi:hypothetical protein
MSSSRAAPADLWRYEILETHYISYNSRYQHSLRKERNCDTNEIRYREFFWQDNLQIGWPISAQRYHALIWIVKVKESLVNWWREYGRLAVTLLAVAGVAIGFAAWVMWIDQRQCEIIASYNQWEYAYHWGTAGCLVRHPELGWIRLSDIIAVLK